MDPTATPATAPVGPPATPRQFYACAFYVGERIDVRALTAGQRIASRPMTVALETGGMAVLFRWGAVVLFDASPQQIDQLLAVLKECVEQPYARPESETVTVRIDREAPELIEGGTVTLRDDGLERLQTLANVLGKTVALAQYESDVKASFDRIEPFANVLEQYGRGRRNLRELLRHIGRVLLNEHKLLGRVEVAEKPDLLWEHPELEPLYARLEAEFELRERAAMLDRKLELIARTVRTVLDLLQHRRTLRVEWYIVILIVVEIFLLVYDMFLPP
jgi:uncharacterized Rmd1/YagE family protein